MVAEEDFPASGENKEKLRFLLNYAVLALSGHNTQPWLFKVNGGEVELYADRTRGPPVVDPEDRALVISCGAALFHLRVAIGHFGYADETPLLPNAGDSDLLPACGWVRSWKPRMRIDSSSEPSLDAARTADPSRHAPSRRHCSPPWKTQRAGKELGCTSCKTRTSATR